MRSNLIYLLVIVGVVHVCVTGIAAEGDAASLSDITVTAEPMDPSARSVQAESITRAIFDAPSLLVISQGGLGAQNDYSIQGSSFSGAGLSLGGLSLGHPQTEHFHSELPIPASILRRPQILTGMDQALQTEGYLVGTVGLDFLPVTARGRMDVGGGEDSWNWQNVLYERPLVTSSDWGQMGVGVFFSRERADALDYDDNDLDRLSGGLHLQQLSDRTRTDFVLGHQTKEFGARGYYGVNPALEATEELDDTLALLSTRWEHGAGQYTRVTAAWRATEDDYVLFLPDSVIFQNHHETTILSAAADGALGLTEAIRGTWRLSVADEDLDSTGLGDQRRQRLAAQILPQLTAGPVRLTAGVRGEAFEGDAPAFLPQAGVDVKLVGDASVFVSYTETVRQPSFTELNYESPGSLGNAGLERQDAQSLESGIRWRPSRKFDGRLLAFGRRSQNTVDWVRELPDSTRWVATNLGTVETFGAQADVRYRPTESLGVSASHAWLEKHDDVGVYASRYVLDYPEQLTKIAVDWDATSWCRLLTSQIFRWQTDNPVRGGDDNGVDGQVALQIRPLRDENLIVTLSVDNVWNDPFQTLPGQDVGDRRGSASVSLAW